MPILVFIGNTVQKLQKLYVLMMFWRQYHFAFLQKLVSVYLSPSLKRKSYRFSAKLFSNFIQPKSLGTHNSIYYIGDYLTNIGANVKKIDKEVKLTKLKSKEVESLVDVLAVQCGLKAEDVGQMLNKRPRILLLDKYYVERCVDLLRNVGLKDREIAAMLKKSPGILTSRIERNLEEKLVVLYNLNVLPPFSTKDVLKIVKKCPALVSTCTPSSLEEKVEFMKKELGFYRRQLSNMILKQPSILTFSKENMKAKFHYCFQEMGVAIPDIARYPRLWQCSLKRLRERHLFLRHQKLITDDTHIDDLGLGKIITPSDSVFAEQVAKSNLVEFQEFAKRIADK